MELTTDIKKVFDNADQEYGEHLKMCTNIYKDFMYMYSENGYDHFKCRNHREYIKVSKYSRF